MTRQGALALVGAVVVSLTLGDSLCAQGLKKSDSKVKATAKATRPDAQGKQLLTLTLNIDKGWHLYANPVDNESFADNKTTVTITSKTRPQAVKVEYPRGIPHTDKILKETFRIYEGQVTIRALVQRASGDTSPLEVTVQVNACDANNCLPQGKIQLTVP